MFCLCVPLTKALVSDLTASQGRPLMKILLKTSKWLSVGLPSQTTAVVNKLICDSLLKSQDQLGSDRIFPCCCKFSWSCWLCRSSKKETCFLCSIQQVLESVHQRTHEIILLKNLVQNEYWMLSLSYHLVSTPVLMSSPVLYMSGSCQRYWCECWAAYEA